MIKESLLCKFKSKFLFVLFILFSISGYSQLKSNEYATWEEDDALDTKEYIKIKGEVYDEYNSKKYAREKRSLLFIAISFYDLQISFINKWIEQSKFKAPKVNIVENPYSDKAVEYVLFRKMFFLDKYEKNLSNECVQILNNKSICLKALDDMKAGESFLPLFTNLKNRLLEEKKMISAVTSQEDSTILKFDATEHNNLGLIYLDKDCSHINSNRFSSLDLSQYNKIYMKLGEITIKNPNYNSIEGNWAWLYDYKYGDIEIVNRTYPIVETYKIYKCHPEYKVKEIDDRKVVYLNDEVVFIEKRWSDNESSNTFRQEKNNLIRQLCILDYKNNKYDIMKSSPSLLSKINEILIDGKDRSYYDGCGLAAKMLKTTYKEMMRVINDKSLEATIFKGTLNIPNPTDEDIKITENKIANLEADAAKAKLFDTDPEYRVAENYVKQLMLDRKKISFKRRRSRIDGSSYLYTTSDGIKIKMEMKVNGDSISETYSIVE